MYFMKKIGVFSLKLEYFNLEVAYLHLKFDCLTSKFDSVRLQIWLCLNNVANFIRQSVDNLKVRKDN